MSVYLNLTHIFRLTSQTQGQAEYSALPATKRKREHIDLLDKNRLCTISKNSEIETTHVTSLVRICNFLQSIFHKEAQTAKGMFKYILTIPLCLFHMKQDQPLKSSQQKEQSCITHHFGDSTDTSRALEKKNNECSRKDLCEIPVLTKQQSHQRRIFVQRHELNLNAVVCIRIAFCVERIR